MKVSSLILGTVFALSLAPTFADAGATTSETATCNKPNITDGIASGGCQGTLRGFRDNADPAAFAALRMRANGSMYFAAQLNGMYVACFLPDTFDAQYLAAFAGNLQNSRFSMSYKGGYCDDMTMIERGSLYGSY